MENFNQGGVEKQKGLPGFDSFRGEQLALFLIENPAPKDGGQFEVDLYQRLISDFESTLKNKYEILYENDSKVKNESSSESDEKKYKSELEAKAQEIIDSGLASPKSKEVYFLFENGELVLYKINSHEEEKTQHKFIRYERPSKQLKPIYESFNVIVTKIDFVKKENTVSVDELINEYGIDATTAYKYIAGVKK